MSERIYMDYHATTPADPRVVAAMLPWLTERFGNASSNHLFGWEAQEAVDRASQQIAALLGVEPNEIVFVSGATEANNLALRGALQAAPERGRHLVVTTIEHPSVLETAAQLEREGCEITRIPVEPDGVVDAQRVIGALRDDTVLCSVMWANNEIGTLQPLAPIAAACRERGVLVHSDAAQATGRVPMAEVGSQLDLISISGHKVYAPKGIGALAVRRRRPRARLAPQMLGGGQQRGLRAGTMPVALAVALGEACALATAEVQAEGQRLSTLRDRLLAQLLQQLDGVHVNGDLQRRLPGNLNVSFEGVEAESLLLELKWIALSSGSACASSEKRSSHVLEAIGLPSELAHASMRFGLGRFSTQDQVDRTAEAVVATVRRMRAGTPSLARATGR